MPLVKVIKKILGLPIRVGGTFEVTGDIDISNGLIIELRPDVFNASGIWTLLTWTGTLTGTIGNITIDAVALGFTAGTPYIDGNAIKITLT